MLSINAENFIEDFKIDELCVGQVGHGYVGQAVEALFKPWCEVIVHDKFKPGTSSLSEVVARSSVIFVAVPTPMKQTGECHTGIVEEVLQDIQTEAVKVGRDLEEFVVVLKSTVPPGFTKRMQKKFALRVLFSPEFLTEANSINDFKNARRVILGGSLDDARVVYKFLEAVWWNRLPENEESFSHPAGPVVIAQCDPDTAELVKLFTNALLATRVTFANEMYQVCQKLDVHYTDVKELLCLDSRVNKSHLLVPGPDGDLGYGGHCFPKDIRNLQFVCEQIGVPERLFTAVIERNDELRKVKDWEKMRGRAVIE